MADLFELKDVVYKDILSIPQLSFQENMVTSVIGQSGSGKTTMLKMLNHLISPDSGKITYKDKSVFDFEPSSLRREVVMLPQHPVMYEGSVKENLLIGRTFSGRSEVISEKELQEGLERMQLEKSLEESTDHLSGGEKQRLALLRVMLMDAPVFLLDEPTSALDDDTEDHIMSTFISFAKEKNKSVILVTHSKTVADTYGDKIVDMTVFKKGGGQRNA